MSDREKARRTAERARSQLGSLRALVACEIARNVAIRLRETDPACANVEPYQVLDVALCFPHDVQALWEHGREHIL